MIIVKLQGGLGNQMFQYCIGRRLAEYYNVRLKFDCSIYKTEGLKNKYITSRNYELNIFSIIADVATQKEVLNFIAKKSLVRKVASFFSNQKIVHESSFLYDPNFKAYGPNCYLQGYWQSMLYFEDISQKIRKDFEFNFHLLKSEFQIAEKITSENSVSIHIRRGDYANDKSTNEYHGLCSIEYYQHAIEFISKKIENPIFFIFSDDLDWVRNNFRLGNKFIIVDINDTKNPGKDMYLMSLCKHNIIANSSFSWWGAWLNNFPDKIVIGPLKWFNDASINTSTLLPSKWYKL